MDLFRWKRTIVRAIAPALLCAVLAAWGVYVLTENERPTYRSFALLNTGIMSSRDIGGAYNRDLVINELENIMNLARSFETREELSARLLARFLALDGPDAQIISPRAYRDLDLTLDEKIKKRHGRYQDQELIYRSIVEERDSLRRYGEAMRFHPLLVLLYGDNELIGTEHLSNLKVNRKGMSDLLEISYSTVDAAWAKATLDLHIEIFIRAHTEIKDQKRGGALSYFKEATDRSRKTLDDAEERLRRFSTENKIINYYEQTRFIANLKNQVDSRFTEEKMVQAASDSTLRILEERLAKRTNLVRLNNVIDDKRRELGQLSKEQVRLEIMGIDSSDSTTDELELVEAKMESLRAELTNEVKNLQLVHGGPEGLEIGRLISEWLAAVLGVEEASGRLEVLANRKVDFNEIYTHMADLGATIKKIEREVHIAEEDYLENLSNLNAALQKEFSSGSNSELRLVDAPVLISTPEKSQRSILVAVGLILGGSFPLILAIALELLSNALLSFAEAERRSKLHVIGGVSRWSRLQRLVHGRFAMPLHATTADLLWQGLRSRSENKANDVKSRLIVVASFRPSIGKTYVIDMLARRLSSRGLKICVISEKVNPDKADSSSYASITFKGVDAMVPGANPRIVCGMSEEQWAYFDVIFWELPAVATGRMPVDIARQAQDAILIHPASAGWNSSLDPFLSQLKESLGQSPRLIVNGFAVDVLLNEWGATLKQLRSWSDTTDVLASGSDSLPFSTSTPVPEPESVLAKANETTIAQKDHSSAEVFPTSAFDEKPTEESLNPAFRNLITTEAQVSNRSSENYNQPEITSEPAKEAPTFRTSFTDKVEGQTPVEEAQAQESRLETEKAVPKSAAEPLVQAQNSWENSLLELKDAGPQNIWELPTEPTTPPPFPSEPADKPQRATDDWESKLLDS